MSNSAINPYQTFRDSTGAVRANGTVTFFVNTTATLASIYSDEALTVAQNNPYTLDASGRIIGDVKYQGLMTLQEANSDGSDVITTDNVTTLETADALRSDLASSTAAKGATLVSFESGQTVQDLASTATDDGTKGFHLVYYPPLSGETGIINYEYEWADPRRKGASVYSGIQTIEERTWYVATTGSDTTGDGTSGTPYATPQKAWDAIPSIVLHKQIISIAAGTYNTSSIDSGDQPRAAILWGKGKITPIRSYGSGSNIEAMISIRGVSGTPSDVVFETTSAYKYGIYINKGNIGLQDLTIQGDGVNKAQSMLVAHRTDTFVHCREVYIDGGAAGAVIGAIVESTGSMEFIAGEIKNVDIGGAALGAGDQLIFASQGNNIINNCTTGVSATYGGYIALNMLQNGNGQVAVVDNTNVTGALLSGGSILKVRGEDHGTDTCQIGGSSTAIECESSHVDLIFAETLDLVNLYAGSTLKVNASNYQRSIQAWASDVHLKTSNSYISPATENDDLRPVALDYESRVYESGTNNINGLGGTVTVVTHIPATATFTANNQGYTMLSYRNSLKVISDSGNAWTGCYIDSTGIREGRVIHVDSDGDDPVQLSNTSGHMDIDPAITFGNATGEYSGATFIMRDGKLRLVGLGQART